MGEMNWTPEAVERARRHVAEDLADSAAETAIAEALTAHMDDHYRIAFNLENRANAVKQKMIEAGVWGVERG